MKKPYSTQTKNKNLISLYADKLSAIQGGSIVTEFTDGDRLRQVSDDALLQNGEELQQIAFALPVILN